MLRRYFVRRVRQHYAFMIIPTLIMFLVIGAIMVNLEQRSLEDSSRNCLTSFDESLEASLYNMGYQIDTMMANASFSLSLKKILHNNGLKLGESSVFGMIKNFFRSYDISYSYIHSIYLYLEGYDRFLSTTAGYVAGIEGYFDQGWMAEYRQMKPEEKLYTSKRMITRNSFEEPLEILSLYYRLTYMDGVIVINVDKSEYGRFLRTMLLGEGQQVLLFNSDGECIGSGSNLIDPGQQEALAEAFSGKMMKDSEYPVKDGWEKIDGTWYFLCTRYSPYMNIFLVSACPLGIMIRRLSYFLLAAVLVLILEAVVMLLLAYRYTKESFGFIEQYIDIFSAAERGAYIEKPAIAEDDEYGMILNNIIYLYLKHSRMQMELQEKEHQKTLAEMAALQMQINPHFIFNTLQIMDFDVIREMGRESQIHRMIGRLSDVVKYALSDPMEPVTIRTEIDYLKSYLDIQNIRFDNAGIIYFEVDDSVWEIQVFRLLLQPLLENCFEHGLHQDGRRIVIKVKLFDRGDHIAVSVTDNGKGMTKDERDELISRINSKSAKSIGLVNLNRRLILHYGEESALRIMSKKDMGTVVCFSIPKPGNDLKNGNEL